MASILKVSGQIENLTPLFDADLLKEHSRRISSRSNLNDRA